MERRASRIDKWFVGWHILYTVVLAGWGAMVIFGPVDDCVGRQPGYWALGFGVLPSLVMLVLGVLRLREAYVLAVIYGAFIALVTIYFTVTLHSNMWLIVLFPLFPFIAEAVVILLRRKSLTTEN